MRVWAQRASKRCLIADLLSNCHEQNNWELFRAPLHPKRGTMSYQGRMKQLIEDIAKALVDIPEEVAVREVQGEQVTVLELKVAPSDLGKVIGKQGRTAQSIRTILGAASMKLKRRFTLEILD